MKYLPTNILTFLLILITGANLHLQAQSSYVLADSSTMSITGTSTLHDWESQVTEIDAQVKATIDSEDPKFSKFNLTVPVKSIKSEKSKMEKKTYEALKEKKYPNITFDLINIKSVEGDTVTAVGNLSIAGETKPITIKAGYSPIGSDAIQLKGSYDMKMTSYNVDPPSVMFGTIKSGDEISIHYNFYLKSENL